MLNTLPTHFSDRRALIAFVRSLSPQQANEPASAYQGGHQSARNRLGQLDAARYNQTRNYLNGAVTGLSPFIRHGLIDIGELRDQAITAVGPERAEGFIRQLAWRDYWQRLYKAHPDWLWQDVEPYKTGFNAQDYAATLPSDITLGQTGVAVIDHFISELVNTGYLHNHARLYLAAYIVHWRRIKWQSGAEWFLTHLLDADLASNNFSWQWVASTFSNKPYYFNLDNVRHFAAQNMEISAKANAVLDGSYEELFARLFPNLEPAS